MLNEIDYDGCHLSFHAPRKLVAPVVHLNGSGKENLLRDLLDAKSKVEEAIKALRDIAPHGRDYYVQDEGALTRARTEHWARIEVMRIVSDELEALALNVHEQGQRK